MLHGLHHHHHGGFGHHGGHHGGHHRGLGLLHHRRHGHFNRGFGLGPAVAVGGLAVGAVAVGVASARARPRSGHGMYEQPMYPAGQYPSGVAVVGIAAPPIAVVAPQPQYIAAPMQQTIPELGVASVKLLPDVVMQQGVVFFTVEVCPDNGAASWQVLRRYNQFNGLAIRLRSQMSHIGCMGQVWRFPKKHLTGCRGLKLEKRRKGLEGWLSQVTNWSQSSHNAGWRMELRTFLCEGAVSLPVAATAPVPLAFQQAAVPTMAPPSPTPQQAPAPMPLPPPSVAPPASVGMEMEVEVPPGVGAGQFLGIEVPSGAQLLVQIPEGVVAGQTMRLWYEAGSITLI